MKYIILLCLLSNYAWSDPLEIRNLATGQFFMTKTLPPKGSEPFEWGNQFSTRDLSKRDAAYIYQLAMDNEGPSSQEKLDALIDAANGDKTKLTAVLAKKAAVEAKYPKP